MVDSLQLYTGSVISVRAFPKAFLDPKNLDLDDSINPRIKKATLDHSPLSVVILPPNLSAAEFLKQEQITSSIEMMVTGHASPAVALIDVGAYFKDQKNEEVAKSLLQVQDTVLYFSTNLNKLAVISREDITERILHTYSADILLDLIPDASKRVTFYDQQHTTGVDIFQDDNGFALVIIGLKTTAIDFYQAVMRMRKLLISQKLVVIVPTNVCAAMGILNPSMEQVLEYLQRNQNESVIGINSMSLVQMIGAVYKGAVYTGLLKGEVSLEALKMWIKSTDSDIDEIVMPLRHRSFRDYIIPNLITHYDSLVSQYFDENRVKELRREAEQIVITAFEGHYTENALYPETSLVSDPSAEDAALSGETPASSNAASSSSSPMMSRDTDQVALSTVESESNLKMEVESQPESYPGDEDFGYHTCYWDSEAFVPMDCQSSQNMEAKRLGGFVGSLNSWFGGLYQEYIGREMIVPELFSPSIFITTGYMMSNTLMGGRSNWIPYCLLLIDNDGTKRLIITTMTEAQAAAKFLEAGKTIHQCEPVLLDPLRGKAQFRKGCDLDQASVPKDVEDLIVQVLAFGGYINAIAHPKRLAALNFWLGATELERAFRVAFLSDIVVGREEMKKHESDFPGKTSLVRYAGVDPQYYETIRNQFDIKILHLWANNRQPISTYLTNLRSKRDHGYLSDMIGIYTMNTGMRTFKNAELEPVVLGAVEEFLATPEFSKRPDFLQHSNAVGALGKSTPHSYIVRGLIAFLQRPREYQNSEHFIGALPWMKDIHSKMEREDSALLKEFLLALKKTELPHVNSRLFAHLLPDGYCRQEDLARTIHEIIEREDLTKDNLHDIAHMYPNSLKYSAVSRRAEELLEKR